MGLPPAPRTDLGPVVDAMREAEAASAAGDVAAETDSVYEAHEVDAADSADDARDVAALVHVGDRFDDDLRYLTRFAGPDRDYAVVVTPERAVLCAPGLFGEQARREFIDAAPDDGVAREVRMTDVGDPAGLRAAAVLADLDVAGDILLVPQHLPHDAAVYLEQAGYELRSTDAVARARRTKTDAEIERIRAVQAAAAVGMRRAEAVLAAAETEGDELVWDGAALTTERLRREVDAVLAREGVRDADNTVVGAGPTAADLHFTGDDDVGPDESVLLDVSPRGPHGYYGDLTRTIVVDGDGGWTRRAYVACEDAREVALAELVPGVTVSEVHEAAATEFAAHGFRVDDDAVGFTHGLGHGVGLGLHEAPSLTSDVTLQVGDVVTVEPGVYDPDRGGVRIEDLVVVRDDGSEILHEYPRSSTPRPAE